MELIRNLECGVSMSGFAKKADNPKDTPELYMQKNLFDEIQLLTLRHQEPPAPNYWQSSSI